jgi:CO/xanthine dehydrogenase Mo-binding subunit
VVLVCQRAAVGSNSGRHRRAKFPTESTASSAASQEAPNGVGEPGVPPIGPTVANAVYAATKKRIRVLPFTRNNLTTA